MMLRRDNKPSRLSRCPGSRRTQRTSCKRGSQGRLGLTRRRRSHFAAHGAGVGVCALPHARGHLGRAPASPGPRRPRRHKRPPGPAARLTRNAGGRGTQLCPCVFSREPRGRSVSSDARLCSDRRGTQLGGEATWRVPSGRILLRREGGRGRRETDGRVRVPVKPSVTPATGWPLARAGRRWLKDARVTA